MIPENLNSKEFEFFVGNDSTTGEFKSIDTFPVESRLAIQTFNFEPQVGRYFKVKKLSREKLADSMYKFQLLGTLH